MMFPNRMRYFAKHIINPLIIRSAGSAHSRFALIRHVGRHSGKPYEIPIMVFPKGEDFIIALTYGPKVDWYRNLRASGQGILLWHEQAYTIEKPELMDRTPALSALPPLQRFILRLVGVQHFARVKSTLSESVRT
jgi:deazaflavin-dependent oxidoreductase (nitroreductase family)